MGVGVRVICAAVQNGTGVREWAGGLGWGVVCAAVRHGTGVWEWVGVGGLGWEIV